MTFTKEKLAELEESSKQIKEKMYSQYSPRSLMWEHFGEKNVLNMLDAATALPHYITALTEAERAIHEYLREKDSPVRCATMRIVTDKELRRALTTIRQLARGKE